MDDATRAPRPVDGTAGLDRRLADAIERLGHGLRSLAQQTARAEGLTPLQQYALLAVARQPDGRREVGALAAEVDVTAPTMSDAVASLERKDLVRRGPGRDARRRRLDLTDEGARVATRLAGWDQPLQAALSRLDQWHKGVALEVLLTVIADLVRDGVITVARTCTTCHFFRQRAHPDGSAPHHCAFLDLPLPQTELRTDCPEHLLDPVA